MESISAPHWGQSRLTTNVTKKRGVRQNIFARTSLDNFCTNDMYSEENQSLPSISRISSLGWLTRNAGYCNHTTPQSRSWKRGSAGRRRLVSPTAGAPARRHWGAWRTASTSRFFLHLAVLLFASTSLCCAYTAKEKTPLITNNADQNSDFRYFMKPSGEETPMERSIAAAANVADAGDTLHFQTLKHIKEWGNTTDVLLVSGRDYVYMLDSALSHNPSKITYLERLAWPTGDTIRKDCHLMAIKEFECENFIRVVEVVENNELMVCGTNAYSPACRYYKREQFNQPPHVKESAFRYESMCRGHCVVPYNPATASATLYTDTDNGHQLFTAVVNDFHGNDPTILRKDKPTLSSNSHWLNDPTFIKMLEYKDKVYVFFREIAKESESGESEKVTYARVAQVCKNDQGGVNVLAHQWTSFLKARLRCGYSKRRNMNFDNMTSVSDIVNGTKDLVFATFTTPWEWTDAPMSAVCAFSMEDIIHVFEKGSFLEEYELDATPLQKPEMPSMGGPSFSAQTSMKKIRRSYAVPQDKVPDMRPGSCLDTQSPNVFSFAKEHPLMYDVIEPQFGRPIFVSFNNIRATQVAVDADAGESGMLMIYVGSEEGKVLRMRGMLGANEGPKAALLESIMVGDKERCEVEGCAIRSLHVSRPQNRSDTRPSVFVAFSDYMVQFPLARCGLYKNKECCSVDPECGWKEGKTESCVRRTSQNRHTLAGTSSDTDKLPESCDIAVGSTNDSNMAMAQQSVIAIVVVVAFFIGLIVGITVTLVVWRVCCNRRRKHIVNHPVKAKSIERLESCNSREDIVSESKLRKECEIEIQQQQRKYTLPPSPSPSNRTNELSFESQKDRNGTSTKGDEVMQVETGNNTIEETPLIVPPIPAKQNPTVKVAVTEQLMIQVQTELEPITENPNSNNSNNCSVTNGQSGDEPRPPALPMKESLSKVPGNLYSARPVQTTSDLCPQPPERQVSPIKKHQSFGGFDRPSKPPVPKKSAEVLRSFSTRRPQSLAPPKSVNKLEDIPIPGQQHSKTPPMVRPYNAMYSPPAPMLIPKRHPAFRQLSMTQMGYKKPLLTSAPVGDIRAFK